MTPGVADRGMPVYPKDALARRDGAELRVELNFAGPETAPRVKRLDENPGLHEDFYEAVRDYVQRFRVPCMKVGAEPVRVQLSFSFVPNDSRTVFFYSTETSDLIKRHRERMDCVRTPSQSLVEYPLGLLNRGQQGVVMVNLKFERADAPPRLTVLHDGGSTGFVKAIQPYVDQMRMPCLPDAQTQEMNVSWIFKMEGGARAWVKDLGLSEFLGVVKGIDKEKVFFDFNTMACPFQVQFRLRQPHMGNEVGQVGEYQSSRRAFTQWLTRLHLNIPDRARELVMAQASIIQVPCGKLDL